MLYKFHCSYYKKGMTLRSRNRLLFFSMMISFPAFIFYIFTVLSYVNLNYPIIDYYRMPFLNQQLTVDIIINGILLCFSITAAFIIFWNFRKTASIEIFFIICFLVSVSLYAVRPLLIILIIERYPITYQLMVVKLIYFSHYLSLAMLFFSGFYKTGFESTRSEWSFIGTILISIMLAGIQPVDLSLFQNQLAENSGVIPSMLRLHSAFQADFALFLSIIFSIAAVLNYLIVWYQTRLKSYLVLTLAVLAISTSLGLIIFRSPWQVQSFALALFSLSVAVFAVQSHQIYKWS